MVEQKVKFKCSDCGTITFLDTPELERRRNDKYNYDHVLCPACCKKVNWKSASCKSCPDKIICGNKYKKLYKNWLDRIDGV